MTTQALITKIKVLRELAVKATPGPDGIVDADWELACVLIKAREILSWGYQHTKTPERKNYTHYRVAAFDLCLAEAKAVRLHQSAANIELYDELLKLLGETK